MELVHRLKLFEFLYSTQDRPQTFCEVLYQFIKMFTCCFSEPFELHQNIKILYQCHRYSSDVGGQVQKPRINNILIPEAKAWGSSASLVYFIWGQMGLWAKPGQRSGTGEHSAEDRISRGEVPRQEQGWSRQEGSRQRQGRGSEPGGLKQ